MNHAIRAFSTFALASLLLAHTTVSAGTAFIFQGVLINASDAPANANYDFEFSLFDNEIGGVQLGTMVAVNDVAVVDGIFSVQLDFGSGPFDGSARWLEIAVSDAGIGSFTVLNPREAITPTPLAINADQIDGLDSTDFLTAEADGSTSNELQNLFDTLVADAGTSMAGSQTDTLNVVGTGTVSTAIVGDTLAITGSSSGDDMGDHTATQDIDLATHSLVGNGGTVGLSVSGDGDVTVGNALTFDGLNGTITSSSGVIGYADDDLTTTGGVTTGGLIVGMLDCTTNDNGGALTAAPGGAVYCADDEGGTNTLDAAYDQGGAGAGRTINADSGPVRFEGSDGIELDTGNFAQTGTNPVEVGSVRIGGDPTSVYVSGRYVYIVDLSSNDLKIIDATDPNNPELVGTLVIGGSPWAVRVAGRYAYVVDSNSDDLKVIDVSNPAAPVLVGSAGLGGTPRDVFVAGRYVYVVDTDSNDLKIIDVTDPTEPSQAGSVAIGGTPVALFVSGAYAYVVDQSSLDLKIVDIINPTMPSIVGSLLLGNSSIPLAIHVSGRYAYITDQGTDALRIIDVSNPSLPSETSAIAAGNTPNALFVSGRYAYVSESSGDDELKVFDVLDPTVPIQIGSIRLGGSPGSVHVSGRYAYVADTPDLTVLDVSGVDVPAMTAHSMTAGNIQVRDNTQIQGQVSVVGGINVGVGGVFSDGDIGVKGTLAIANDIAPTTSQSNRVQLFAEDVAGSSELKVRDEAGNVTTLSPHNFGLIGKQSEPLAWSYYSENSMGRINVDMLRALRVLEWLTGENLIHFEQRGGATSDRPSNAAITLPDRLDQVLRETQILSQQQARLQTRLERLQSLLSAPTLLHGHLETYP